jgi:hypothetical protein
LIRISESLFFDQNKEDNCIHAKFKKGNYIFLVLYLHGILLASSDKDLLVETERFFPRIFEMKDMGETPYIIEIEIHTDRQKRIL